MTIFDLAMKIIDSFEYMKASTNELCLNKEAMRDKGWELFNEACNKLDYENREQYIKEFKEEVEKLGIEYIK